jgi:ElaB/YqjD/DUF883 family membrane-anchored ribosome-binding protein
MSEYGSEPGMSRGGSGTPAGVQERAVETVRETANQAQEKAGEVGGQARERAITEADRRTTEAGDQLRSVADALRRASGTLREEGKDRPAGLVEPVADRMEQLARYLAETDGNGLLRDAEDFGRRRPWAIAGIGALAGFAASRFLKASSANRRAKTPAADGHPTAAARSGYEPADPAIPVTAGTASTPAESGHGGSSPGEL